MNSENTTNNNGNNQSFINKIKEFFNDIPHPEEIDEQNFFNEASVYQPPKRVFIYNSLHHQPTFINKFKIPPRKEFQQLNRSMPNFVNNNRNQFSIDDEDTPGGDELFETEVHHIYQPKSTIVHQPPQTTRNDQPQQLPQNLNFIGFEEIDIKPLLMSKLIEKEPQKDPYIKGSTINYPPQSTFKITKTPKRYQRIIDYIMGTVNREIVIDGGWIYVLKKVSNDKFIVCSATPLDRLFKILIKKDEKKPPIKIAFTNDRKNIYMLPHIKEFKLINKDQQDLFFIKLRSEVQKHGYDLQVK